MSVSGSEISISAAAEEGGSGARTHPSLTRYSDWLQFLCALPRDVPALQVVVVNGPAVTGMSERVEALMPGPDLAVRTRAAFAWQDEVLAQLS